MMMIIIILIIETTMNVIIIYYTRKIDVFIKVFIINSSNLTYTYLYINAHKIDVL